MEPVTQFIKECGRIVVDYDLKTFAGKVKMADDFVTIFGDFRRAVMTQGDNHDHMRSLYKQE